MRDLADFIGRFLLPLVAGGEVHVGAPIAGDGLERLLAQARDGAAAGERSLLGTARRTVAGELVLSAPPLDLELEDVALAAAAHDLLFVGHPAMDRASSRRIEGVVAGGRAALEHVAPVDPALPRFHVDVLARHTLLHRLFHLEREDIEIAFWAGKASFRGQRPPARLTAWPSVRRVRQTRRWSSFEDEVLAPAGVPLLARVLATSPLTDLLAAGRRAPRFALGPALRLLACPELARAACQRLSAQGIEHIGGALWRALESLDDPLELRAGLQLCLFLHGLECVAALRGDPQAPAPVFERLARGAVPVDEPLCRFFAVFLATPGVLGEDARPPGLLEDPELRARVARYESDARAIAETWIDRVKTRLGNVLAPSQEESLGASQPP